VIGAVFCNTRSIPVKAWSNPSIRWEADAHVVEAEADLEGADELGDAKSEQPARRIFPTGLTRENCDRCAPLKEQILS
jgi:hypothetical protein